MSVVTYNGLTLPYAFITDFRQRALGDDLSNTDWVLQEFDITAQFHINSNYLALIAPNLLNGTVAATNNAADILNAVREQLMMRRRELSIKVNGVEMIPNNAGLPGTVDAQNGPVPIDFNPMTLNATDFLCTYHIIAHYWVPTRLAVQLKTPPTYDTESFPTENSVLWNRWSEWVDIDDCQYTTRTREGKVVIRSDNAAGLIADQVRSQMAVVGIPAGFLRERSHYKVDPSGLGIEYSIVDKECYLKPPYPSFKAEGEYTETAMRGAGAKRYGECRVKLYGDKLTPQANLIKTAIAVACSKLYIRGSQLGALQGIGPKGFSLLENAVLKQNLYQNEVEFAIRAMITIDTKQVDGIAAFQNMSTVTPFSPANSTYTPAYRDRGTACFLLQAAAYYDPSLANTIMGAGQTATFTPQTPVGDGLKVPRDQWSVGLAPGQAGVQSEP
jgi:hypothetical protein